MQLTMTGEYAIRAMIHLASKVPGSVVHISEISGEWEIPESFLRKIVAQLSRAGLVQSQRGTGGGIQLAKDANAVTLLDVIEAVEGKMHLNKCLISPARFCSRTSWCAVHLVWYQAQEKLKEVLRSRSLQDLAASSLSRRQELQLSC